MKNLKILTYLFVMVTMTFATQCKKETVKHPHCSTDTIPSCIRARINLFLQQPRATPPAEVWKYDYLGSTVYYLPNEALRAVDGCSELLDVNCNMICSPDGCFTGNGDGRCPDFFNDRRNGVLIWRDTR